MLAGARELWINFTRLQMSFASESAEKKAVSEEVVDEKIRLPVSGTLPCHAGGRGFESRRSRQIVRSERRYSFTLGALDGRKKSRSSLLPLQMLHVRCCHRAHDPLRKLLVREAGLEFPKGPSEQTGGSVPHQSLNATAGSGEGCVWPDLGKQGG